jgi:hypothetical protein
MSHPRKLEATAALLTQKANMAGSGATDGDAGASPSTEDSTSCRR